MELDIELIGVIAALLVQAAGTVWWAATLSGKVMQLESRFTDLEDEQREQDRSLASINSLMARMDERTASILLTMERVEKRLDEAVSK